MEGLYTTQAFSNPALPCPIQGVDLPMFGIQLASRSGSNINCFLYFAFINNKSNIMAPIRNSFKFFLIYSKPGLGREVLFIALPTFLDANIRFK